MVPTYTGMIYISTRLMITPNLAVTDMFELYCGNSLIICAKVVICMAWDLLAPRRLILDLPFLFLLNQIYDHHNSIKYYPTVCQRCGLANERL